MLLDVIEEESFDTALVENNLLESGDSRNNIWDLVGPTYDTVFAGVLYTLGDVERGDFCRLAHMQNCEVVSQVEPSW